MEAFPASFKASFHSCSPSQAKLGNSKRSYTLRVQVYKHPIENFTKFILKVLVVTRWQCMKLPHTLMK
jgi:hypothetical protein